MDSHRSSQFDITHAVGQLHCRSPQSVLSAEAWRRTGTLAVEFISVAFLGGQKADAQSSILPNDQNKFVAPTVAILSHF